MSTIVLVHGWGFDQRIWDGVCAHLHPAHRVARVDFGFFGSPQLPEVSADEPVVAVGHSLGACWWLAQARLPWQQLLIVNGFPRFTETAGYAPAVAPRVLARMRVQWARNPQAVLDEFRALCGAPAAPNGLDADLLAQGLGWLDQWDGRARLGARAADIHALASTHDPIVPAGMTRQAFAALPAGRLSFADAASHVLPLSAPARVARLIDELAERAELAEPGVADGPARSATP